MSSSEHLEGGNLVGHILKGFCEQVLSKRSMRTIQGLKIEYRPNRHQTLTERYEGMSRNRNGRPHAGRIPLGRNYPHFS